MELLERVVREHGCADLLGDAEQERVAATDRTRGGRDERARRRELLVTLELGWVDAMGKGGIDDDGDGGIGKVAAQLLEGGLELRE